MDFQAVKGTRDFYPDRDAAANWIADAWRRVSLRNGFEEYDSPIFEYLDLFTAKSGDGDRQPALQPSTDRGGRNWPSGRRSRRRWPAWSTPRSTRCRGRSSGSRIPRLCRAENPQKGRLREFFQWNVDIIGEDDVAGRRRVHLRGRRLPARAGPDAAGRAGPHRQPARCCRRCWQALGVAEDAIAGRAGRAGQAAEGLAARSSRP